MKTSLFFILALLALNVNCQNKGFLVGIDTGKGIPSYFITSDSSLVCSTFKSELKLDLNIQTVNKQKIVSAQAGRTFVYVEAGTFKETRKGKAKFKGFSENKYFIKSYKLIN